MDHFETPSPKGKLFWYDFEKAKWFECQLLEKLPYDLGEYILENNETIITCSDSYRLSKRPELNLELMEEKKWREKILCPKAEVDFHQSGKWIKAEVSWVKSDVIPGVVNLCHRQGKSWIGYYFYESRKLAKSCSFTRKFTKEELEKEKEYEIKAVELRKTQKEELSQLKSQVKQYSIENIEFYDLPQAYRTFKRYPKEITLKDLQRTAHCPKGTEKYFNTPSTRCLGGLISFASSFDIVFASAVKHLTKETFCFREGDAFCDISIIGGTYAHLVLSSGEKYSLDQTPEGFTFRDFTYENPLFHPRQGNGVRIQSDGKTLTYKVIVVSAPLLPLLGELTPEYTVSHLPSRKKWLLLGNLWMQDILLDAF